MLGERPCSRLTPPRQSGRPFAATREPATLWGRSGVDTGGRELHPGLPETMDYRCGMNKKELSSIRPLRARRRPRSCSALCHPRGRRAQGLAEDSLRCLSGARMAASVTKRLSSESCRSERRSSPNADDGEGIHVKITEVNKKAFRITAKLVAAPLSFDEARVKYRASDADVRAVRLFVLSDSTAGPSTVFGGKDGRPSATFRRRSRRVTGTRKK